MNMMSSSDNDDDNNNNNNNYAIANVNSSSNDEGEGCKHYKNKCEILSPCCLKYYRCFRCHDDENANNDNDDESCDQQSLDRSKVTKIRCIECKLEQEPSKHCKGCNIEFAEYVCLDCSLYRQNCDDESGGIFHCYDCKICRIGKGLGISHWHCNSCVACLTIDIDFEEHTKICRPLSAQDDCCICFESMKDSQQELVIGKYCGHFLHKNCCDAYFQTGKIDCPICKRPLIEETFTSPRRIRIGIQWITNFVVYMIIPAIISSFVTMHVISVVDMYCVDTGELLLSFWVVLVWLLLKLQLHQFGNGNQHQGLHDDVPVPQQPWWLRWYTIVSAGILLSCSMCYFSVCIF